MATVELPALSRPPTLRAIVIDKTEIAGAELFTITVWAGGGRPPRRKWYADRTIAIAHAAERADELAAPMIDLTDEAA